VSFLGCLALWITTSADFSLSMPVSGALELKFLTNTPLSTESRSARKTQLIYRAAENLIYSIMQQVPP
jgi:hypothetical protein